MTVMEKIKTILGSYRLISLEPVFLLFCVNLGLIAITTQGLYLNKACKVNLNYSEDICNNIYSNLSIQTETQKYVSQIQAYNGMLQSAPGIVFTLFAGPLTDSFGRKPLIICALFGYFLLDIIFLINSFWFYELKVEYLLFECLQDLTGGATCFYLASYSYMTDVTSPETRTKRLSLLDSFMPIGFLIGLPLGTFIRNNYGFVALFSTASLVILTAILYVFFVVKESIRKQPTTEKTQNVVTPHIRPDKDCCKNFWYLTISGFRTMFKERPNGGRRWVICFAMVFCISKAIDSGAGSVSYMFYRLQYKVTNTQYSTLSTYFSILMYISQIAVVPLMSGWLRWRDTTIIIIATIGTITGTFITAFTTSLNVLYFAYILWMLWNTITTISRSGISKFMESTEVGKAFTVLGILQTLFPFITKPFFSYLYKSTLETFPGAYRVLCGSLYILVLILLIYTHFGMKRQDRKTQEEKPAGEEMLNLKSSSAVIGDADGEAADK